MEEKELFTFIAENFKKIYPEKEYNRIEIFVPNAKEVKVKFFYNRELVKNVVIGYEKKNENLVFNIKSRIEITHL